MVYIHILTIKIEALGFIMKMEFLNRLISKNTITIQKIYICKSV